MLSKLGSVRAKILLFSLCAFLTFNASAQTDLFSSIKSLGVTEYKKYRLSGSDNSYTVTSQQETFKIEVQNNIYGKAGGISGKNIESGVEEIEYKPRYHTNDHYTHPSFIYAGGVFKEGYLMVDSVLYELIKMREDGSYFEFRYIFIPQFKSTPKGEKTTSGSGKKMTMKEKLAAAKEKVAALAGSPFVISQKTKDHKKIVSDYIAAMKVIQKNNPYSANIQAEVQGMKDVDAAKTAATNAKNEAYWQSEEGKLMRKRIDEDNATPDYFTIKNTTNQPISVMNEMGNVTVVSYFDSRTFFCTETVYYLIKEAGSPKKIRGSLVADGDKVCGQTIEIN